MNKLIQSLTDVCLARLLEANSRRCTNGDIERLQIMKKTVDALAYTLVHFEVNCGHEADKSAG